MQKSLFPGILRPLRRYSWNQRSYGSWDLLWKRYQRQSKPGYVPAKLELLTVPSISEAQIRCGFIGPGSSSVLDTLVIDVYGDQGWIKQFLQRDRKAGSLVRYGPEFHVDGISGLDDITTFYLPSPWLQEAGCEILEIPSEESKNNDKCHLYVRDPLKSALTEPIWPTVPIALKSRAAVSMNSTEEPLHGLEVDAETALDAMLQFISDKSTVTRYLQSLDTTNILNISKMLSSKLANKEQIFRDLERSVLGQITRNDDTVERYEKLVRSKQNVNETIEEWSRAAHQELQTEIEPLLASFASQQLSLWKIYTYSESKLSLKLHELCNITNDLKMVQNLSHIYGSLDIPQQRIAIINPNYPKSRVPQLHKQINKSVYLNFLQLQFPLLATSVAGYITELCSAYSMGALASLGIVLGLKRVKDTWASLLAQFQQQIREQCRVGIEHNKQSLIENWRTTYAQRESELRETSSLLKQIASEVK